LLKFRCCSKETLYNRSRLKLERQLNDSELIPSNHGSEYNACSVPIAAYVDKLLSTTRPKMTTLKKSSKSMRTMSKLKRVIDI
jgi:hypothetical protein